MSSKINGIDHRPPAPVGAGRPVQRPRDASTGGGQPQEQGTGVRITDTASQLAALEQSLNEMPAIDEARVAEIRLALEEGRYRIDPERVADRMLQLERALAPLGRGAE